MILKQDNEIDKKLLDAFNEEIINNINKDTLGFILMTIPLEEEDKYDINFKIYYSHKYSKEIYDTYNHNFSVINFLNKKNMLDGFEISHDKYDKCARFNAKLRNANNKNILDLFNYLESKTNFITKYKEEILSFSRIGHPIPSDWDYESLFFVGFSNDENNNIEQVKCYWINEILENEYYINFIKESGIKGLQELLPLVQKIIPNKGKHLWGEGIDYSKLGSSNHKIYICYTEETCKNLVNTFSNNSIIVKNIKLITDWAKVHTEFLGDGFAIGKNSKNKLVLNSYFRLKK